MLCRDTLAQTDTTVGSMIGLMIQELVQYRLGREGRLLWTAAFGWLLVAMQHARAEPGCRHAPTFLWKLAGRIPAGHAWRQRLTRDTT